MPAKKPSVFDFIDAVHFLKSYLEWRKLLNPDFSIAEWASEMNASKVTLRFVLSRRRSISVGFAALLIKDLLFDNEEEKYFEALISYTQARTASSREMLGASLLKAHKERFKQVEIQTASSSSHALVPVILTLLTFDDVERSVEGLTKILNLDEGEVRAALALLVTDKIINVDASGEFKFRERTFRLPDSINLRPFYEYWIDRSKDALDLPRSERNYQSLKFALTEAEYGEALEKIQNYSTLLLSRFQSDELQGRKLYMFETCLFPISQKLDSANGTVDVHRISESPVTV